MPTPSQMAADQIGRILDKNEPLPSFITLAYSGEIVIAVTGTETQFHGIGKPDLTRIVALLKDGDSLVVNCTANTNGR